MKRYPVFLVLKGIRDILNHAFIQIGFKSENAGNPLNRHVRDFPVDITCWSELIFVYIDIIEHQNVGDVRAPVIKISESERRLRNGSINTVTPIHHKSYKNLDYKPILSNSIQISQVELRNETGKLISFTGNGKIIVGLKIQKINYYECILQQSSISIIAAFFRKLQTKMQWFWSACCRYWKGFSAISTQIFLARIEKD